jgi:hypothetical protein
MYIYTQTQTDTQTNTQTDTHIHAHKRTHTHSHKRHIDSYIRKDLRDPDRIFPHDHSMSPNITTP